VGGFVTFHSQPDSPPLHFFPEEEDNMAAPAPAPAADTAPPRPPTPVRPGLVLPTFEPAGADPTREELLDYREAVAQFFVGVDFTLQFLGVVAPAWPDIQVARDVTMVGQIWQRVAQLGQAVTRAHQTMVTAQQEIMEGEVTNLRMARGAMVGTGTGGNRRAKGVVPTKFRGKRGDLCRTFLAGCKNYRAMEPGAFDDDQQLIHWALQLCEDKARPWAVRQMERLDNERDSQNQPPRELRDWQCFLIIFRTQFDNPGLKDAARQRWRDGFMQTGKVVDYFNEVEDIVLRLNYDKDTSMVMDQVTGRLKEHIRIKFIGRTWFAFDDMKAEIIPYDEAHWQIKKPPPQEKTKNTTMTKYERASTSVTATYTTKTQNTEQQFLPKEEFQYCVDNKLCFKCKSEGREVKGLARYHPNHLTPTQLAEGKGRRENTKNISQALTSTHKTRKTPYVESQIDSESDTDTNKPKN
jgi:hypothetical protein